MNSIRTKTTLLAVCIAIVSILVITVISTVSIRNLGNRNSDQILHLLCETGQKNLNAYFESVEQSVKMVAAFVEEDLADTDESRFSEHMERVRHVFWRMANTTQGVFTYYYRIDPEFSKTEKGFWYVNMDGTGFEEHKPTDIELYDTGDTSALVWFTVPKSQGKAIWLPPYITDNLDKRVISYNVPVYWHDRFIGVIGIEIDYTTMAEQVDNIRLYDNGYAFINDADGFIIYHARMDVTTMETQPKVPAGLLSDSNYIRYDFEGVSRQAVWLPLSNGMRLNVTVPISEINADWIRLVREILIVSAVLLAIFIFVTLRFTARITKPLRDLTEAAEQIEAGNYDVALKYDRKDEIGTLTRTVKDLVAHLKVYITDLNNLAYADALTMVKNKGAFEIHLRRLDLAIQQGGGDTKFAIGIFDCDDLKTVNDQHGHDKGDAYLKSASALICHVFQHSPVFRIGGDEFAIILQNEDYQNREKLIHRFIVESDDRSALAQQDWNKVRVAMGVADYDPAQDKTAADVVRRADRLMYINKKERKETRITGV